MARCLKPPLSFPDSKRTMQYCSRPVDSSQNGIHRRLYKVLSTHLRAEFRKPISVKNRESFFAVDAIRRRLDKPVVLDSGCGTGASTAKLAALHPDALVIGVDKSSHRLAKGQLDHHCKENGNRLLVKMDLVDFWRLALQQGWRLQKHYLLYPNPWPLPKHLQRRWYAHPVFPDLLRLGGILEMRCNWRVYAEEFLATMEFIAPGTCKLDEYHAKTSISLFELKFSASGHTLYRCYCNLDNLVKINQ